MKKTLRIDWAAALKTVVDDARKQVEVGSGADRGRAGSAGRADATQPDPPRRATAAAGNGERWRVWAPLAAVAAFAFAAVFVPLAQSGNTRSR